MIAITCFGELALAPLLAGLLLVLSPLKITSAAGLFVGGVVTWTFAEYVFHRFVFHGLIRKEHGIHHAHPDQPVLKILWQIWVCFAVVHLIAGGCFLAGALMGYAWYLFVHHCSHHGPEKVPRLLLHHHHRQHHRFATRNYGVSPTIWDHLFGTMLR
jgi:sterol desaturase/sphingolipid hydroxylase (fatty acid hydroxylase superfamily)